MTAPVDGHAPRGANMPETGSPELERPPTLREAVFGDLEHIAFIKETPFPSLRGLLDVLTLPGTWAVIVFRLGSTAHHRGMRPISRFLYFLNIVVFGADMPTGAVIQPGLALPHPVGVAFAGGIRVGRRALLMRNIAIGGAGNPKRPGHPVLGDDVTLLDSAAVFGPVMVGDRSVIGANAVVVDDVPPDVFVYGSRKSDTIRPLSELGLGKRAEADLGYGIAGRQAKRIGMDARAATAEKR